MVWVNEIVICPIFTFPTARSSTDWTQRGFGEGIVNLLKLYCESQRVSHAPIKFTCVCALTSTQENQHYPVVRWRTKGEFDILLSWLADQIPRNSIAPLPTRN
jgi:hypothetical protein